MENVSAFLAWYFDQQGDDVEEVPESPQNGDRHDYASNILDLTQEDEHSGQLKISKYFQGNGGHVVDDCSPANVLDSNNDDDLDGAEQNYDDLDDIDYANLLVFGNKCFRPQQRKIVEEAMKGRDIFVLMPTGGGKSLCYQLPAVLSKGITIVITPLLSLMQDQIQSLCSLSCGGVPATFLSSQQTLKESRAVHDELNKENPTMKLLFLTPEQLVAGEKLRKTLQKLHQNGQLARLVVDECHCVSQWGHGAFWRVRMNICWINLIKCRIFNLFCRLSP